MQYVLKIINITMGGVLHTVSFEGSEQSKEDDTAL